MKVMKFGGTSVGSVDSILKVKQIVEAAEEPVIVVVSALGGITDKLINTSQMAANGDAEYEKEYREIVNRHIEMVYTVIPAGEGRTVLLDKVNELLSELKDIFQGIYLIKDLSSKTFATIVSYGERLSSIIAATLIKGAVWYDSRNFIKTEKKHAKHILDSELTTSLVKETFDEIPQVALVPGFISTDKNSGEVTNLGRGGSDYTASIIAASLNAASLEIWTDVDGFMTADPRVISTAYTINELSYVEAMELCNFGAKVVYPPTIYPVCHKNIPILIKNTFNGSMEQTDKVQPIEVQSPDEKLIARVMAIINKEIANPNLSVEMIAAEAGISRVHLYRKIKEFTNQSPRNFIRNVRLKQAALLLAQKHHNITEVAEAVGFANTTHFSTAFKELFGVSPTIYMEQSANNAKSNIVDTMEKNKVE